MSRRRLLTSFSRHRRNKWRTLAGVDDGSLRQSGSRSRIAAIVSETVSRWNALWPVSVSYNTQPNAQMSARLSTGLPRVCSGLM